MKSTTSKRAAVLERPADHGLLTVPEVAARLRVHKSVLYEWLRLGYIAYCRVGRLIRIHQADVAAYIRRNRVESRPALAYDRHSTI